MAHMYSCLRKMVQCIQCFPTYSYTLLICSHAGPVTNDSMIYYVGTRLSKAPGAHRGPSVWVVTQTFIFRNRGIVRLSEINSPICDSTRISINDLNLSHLND